MCRTSAIGYESDVESDFEVRFRVRFESDFGTAIIHALKKASGTRAPINI